MRTKLKAWLSRFAPGRMLLHFGCICRGGKVGFHWAGIRRDLPWR